MINDTNIAYVSSILLLLFPFPQQKKQFCLSDKNGIGYMENVIITHETYENAQVILPFFIIFAA